MTTDVQSTLRTHIQIRGVRKTFGDKVLFDGLDLDLPREAITCIFGPNGCGKSTLLNIIAGLAPIDGGSILFGGRSLAQTRIGYVFQNYRDALFPWLSAGPTSATPSRSRAAESRSSGPGSGSWPSSSTSTSTFVATHISCRAVSSSSSR